MKIAYVTAIGVNKHGGTQKCSAWLLEELSNSNNVSVFTISVEGININKVHFYKIPAINYPSLPRYIMFFILNSLLFTLKKNNYDIIHATGPDSLWADVITVHFCSSAWLYSVKQGSINLPKDTLLQKIKTFHNLIYWHLTAWCEKIIYHCNNVKYIITVSEGLKKALISHCQCSPDNIVVIPNPIDEQMILIPVEQAQFRNEIRTKHNLTENDKIVLFVAASHWKTKGLLLLLEALTYLPRPDVKLLVVGKDDQEFYADLARRLGVDKRVIFAGFSKDIRKYYAATEILLHPSYFEGSPLTVLEAAAAGLPVVVTKVSGVEDWIQDGYNGFFVKHDPQDIAEKIKLLVEDEDLRRKMGQNARRSAGNYTRQEVARRTMEVYRRVIAQKQQESKG